MMRDICARFKYSERDVGGENAICESPVSPAVSTPGSSTMTDRDRSSSEASVDGDDCAARGPASNNSANQPPTTTIQLPTTPTTDPANPTNVRSLPTPTPCDCPPRELIHRNLRRYHREMEAGRLDLDAVGARIREDLAPYSILKLGGFSLGNVAPKLLANVLVHETTNLRTLDLGFNRINDRGAALLAAALERNTSLTSLYLSGNDIGPDGAHALALALAKNSTLKSLHLSGNNIGEAGAIHLANGLEQNHALRSLYIGTNGIGGGAGMQRLAQMLQTNKSLKELTLGQNKIGSVGLAHLAAAFATGNVQLTTLEVGKNGVGADGAIALAKALCVPTVNRLQNLYLDNNPLGDTGAGACGALLAKNHTLRVLDLSYTQMSLLGLRDLSTGLSYSSSLLCLLLDGHDWASTQYMKKTNGLHGVSLSTKGASNFAASCLAGAVNANVKSVLYKLTGVDLTLVLGTLPLSNEVRALLSGEVEGTMGSGGRAARPLDLVTRNERILRYMHEQRVVVNSNKRKSDDVEQQKSQNSSTRDSASSTDADADVDPPVTEPKLQRRRTSSENYQNLTVDTAAASASSRPPLRPAMTPTSAAAAAAGRPAASRSTMLMRNPLPRHPSWATEKSRLALKSPRYESTMEVQVRKVMGEIAKLPFDGDEYAALQTYYLGGCHGPKTDSATVSSPSGEANGASSSPTDSTVGTKVADQVLCPACRSSRLAQYPESMMLKARMETKPDSTQLVLVLLRQLHYLVGVFQNIDNPEPRIDAILVSMHTTLSQ